MVQSLGSQRGWEFRPAGAFVLFALEQMGLENAHPNLHGFCSPGKILSQPVSVLLSVA